MEELRYITHEFLNMYKTGKTFYGLAGILRYMFWVLGSTILSIQWCLSNDSWCFTVAAVVTIAARPCPWSPGRIALNGIKFLFKLFLWIQKASIRMSLSICFFVTYTLTVFYVFIKHILQTGACALSKGTHAWDSFKNLL